MMTAIDDSHASDRARISFRRALREPSETGTSFALLCPRREQILEVSDCRHCDHLRGVCVDADNREVFVRCAFEQVEPIPPGASEHARANKSAPLSEVMSAPALCVNGEDDLQTVLALFIENAISAAPVVDANGRAIGIVTKTDLLRSYYEREEAVPGAPTPDALVTRAIMSHAVFTLHEDADLSRAAALMAYEGVHHAVVVSVDGRALGIVSSLDILRWFARGYGYVMPGRH